MHVSWWLAAAAPIQVTGGVPALCLNVCTCVYLTSYKCISLFIHIVCVRFCCRCYRSQEETVQEINLLQLKGEKKGFYRMVGYKYNTQIFHNTDLDTWLCCRVRPRHTAAVWADETRTKGLEPDGYILVVVAYHIGIGMCVVRHALVWKTLFFV